MGSKQRGRKGGQGFGNARPVKPLRQSQGKEHASPRDDGAEEIPSKDGGSGVHWAELLTLLQPFYPQVGPQGGRPRPIP